MRSPLLSPAAARPRAGAVVVALALAAAIAGAACANPRGAAAGRPEAEPSAAALASASTAAPSAERPTRPPTAPGPAAAHLAALAPARVQPVRRYITAAWGELTRSLTDLPRAAADPKFPLPAGAALPVYLAADEDRARVETELARVLPEAERARLTVRALPTRAPEAAQPPGLLYLPGPYVVPGGRFNEMYGWDSYFIVLGLLRDGRADLARAQTDNFLYEVERYGKVLNANRTYYLTRSQPPLLSPMVRALRGAPPPAAGDQDRAWLERARAALARTHQFWTSPPHLAGDTGLSRYYDVGSGPAPEVVSSERDSQGRTHYDRVRAYYRARLRSGATPPVAAYDLDRYYDRRRDTLTELFYLGDRSMRESGFDPSERWGPFGVDVIHYAPVCLNTLLAVLEGDLALLSAELGDQAGARRYADLLAARRARLDRYLWDEARGLYLDWNFERGARRDYPFATTFWPLWAGLASPAQAARVRDNLPRFERPGGLVTSTTRSGSQWDAPFGWAPLQLFAVLGLERHGYLQDARRLAAAFASLVVEDFERRGAIVEKYDVERRSSAVEQQIQFGYAENVVGFGWTNGVFLELLDLLRRTAPRAATAPPPARSAPGRQAARMDWQ